MASVRKVRLPLYICVLLASSSFWDVPVNRFGTGSCIFLHTRAPEFTSPRTSHEADGPPAGTTSCCRLEVCVGWMIGQHLPCQSRRELLPNRALLHGIHTAAKSTGATGNKFQPALARNSTSTPGDRPATRRGDHPLPKHQRLRSDRASHQALGLQSLALHG